MAYLNMLNDVPIIDISAWLDLTASNAEAREESALAWHKAMRDFGCVIIIGHGIAEDMFSTINAESNEFFHMKLSEKLKYNHGAYGHPLGGYSPPGKEIVALSTGDESSSFGKKPKFDPVETLVFTSHPSNYKTLSRDGCPLVSASLYYERMESVLKAIHSLSCGALGLKDVHYFEQFYDVNIPGNDAKGSTGNALKFAHYPPLTAKSLKADLEDGTAETEFNTSVRYGAHTDYQGFTILRPDKNDWHYVDVPLDASPASTTEGDSPSKSSSTGPATVRVLAGGLEVYHRGTHQWIQVKIPKHLNALVINAGDFIQRWTNDIWHSPLHRVVTATIASATACAPTTGSGSATVSSTTTAESEESADCGDHAGRFARQSIVFFSGPLEHCVIECIDPALMKPEVVGDMRVRKYAPIRSGDHLLLKLNRTNNSAL